MIKFYPVDYVNNPMNVAQNKKMVSVDAALEIDLTGQVCSDSLGYKFFSGIGSQVDFIQGATLLMKCFGVIFFIPLLKNPYIIDSFRLLWPGPTRKLKNGLILTIKKQWPL